jgi:hypothetical protein
MRRVEQESKDAGRVRGVTVRVGALAGFSAEFLRHGIDHYAGERWGYHPEVVVERSTDPTEPDAQGVVLVSIKLD